MGVLGQLHGCPEKFHVKPRKIANSGNSRKVLEAVLRKTKRKRKPMFWVARNASGEVLARAESRKFLEDFYGAEYLIELEG